MDKPSIRWTLTALATLALCGASTMSASTVSASTVSASTVSASTVSASTVSASTVSASTVSASTGKISPEAKCASTTKGVTEVVDFAKLRSADKIEVACDPTDPKTGLAALKGAGFTYSFVPKYPGFVCRIDYLPKPCNGAPATAYWSYWHAKRGGKWILSKLGAGSYHPKPGSVQGWAFGAGKPPRISPP